MVVVGCDVQRCSLPVKHLVHLALIAFKDQLQSSARKEVRSIENGVFLCRPKDRVSWDSGGDRADSVGDGVR